MQISIHYAASELHVIRVADSEQIRQVVTLYSTAVPFLRPSATMMDVIDTLFCLSVCPAVPRWYCVIKLFSPPGRLLILVFCVLSSIIVNRVVLNTGEVSKCASSDEYLHTSGKQYTL